MEDYNGRIITARILFTGGGTLGSVMPLLAIWEQCGNAKDTAALWLGTRTGPERTFVERAGIPFRPIHAGKIRRYADVRNVVDPLFILVGFIQSCFYIIRFNPDVIINAGSFVGVPAIIAGRLFGKRCIIWQLDMVPSMSNKIAAAWAGAIAVSVKEAGAAYDQKKIHVVGMPVRKSIQEAERARCDPARTGEFRSHFGINDDAPVLLVLGGGTGAMEINALIWKTYKKLTETMHVIHITGKGKESSGEHSDGRYHQIALSEDLPRAYAIADVVITRAGMGTISELAYFGLPAVVVPIPDSHQEKNADFLKRNHAAIVCDQRVLSPELLTEHIENILGNVELQKSLGMQMIGLLRSDPERMCSLIRGEV
ncbi:UDP-N-acetylglucosamine--N-acetylmuramyl-(pentapeptide) pyrophosphoryl-undecaprenol N-acetylglucosamine transferase [Candidatus Uhrbacteria bacterium]|nr:UDP-N-acetylglucosamine--N-acetylmuramyl-(pentapeptide) pyrophosphoryl-undecaprenol N-acetylglucosamine transferase [Candidatus Uhrbacteria bacterium]